MLEHAGNTPVFCPACGKPMVPSEPTPITNRMFEIVYRCDACDATTLRSVRVQAGEPGVAQSEGERRGADAGEESPQRPSWRGASACKEPGRDTRHLRRALRVRRRARRGRPGTREGQIGR